MDNIATYVHSKYIEYHNDVENLSDRDFGKKWGYGKPSSDFLSNKGKYSYFANWCNHFVVGNYDYMWKKLGLYDDIKRNQQSGYVSYQYYSNWQARQLGQQNYYWVNKKGQKIIYKLYKDW